MNQIHTTLPVGSGIFDFADGLIEDTTSTVTSLVVLIGIIVAIIGGVRGRGVGGTIMGIAVGALICALPFIIPALGNTVEEEVDNAGASNANTVISSIE